MIKVHNDGKGKHQSYSAWLDCGVIGYGASQAEALDDLRRKVAVHVNNILSDMVIGNVVRCDYKGDELPPVHQPPIDRTIQTRFVDAGEHKPMPFPEEPTEHAVLPCENCGEPGGNPFAQCIRCGLPTHRTSRIGPKMTDDVAELVRRVRSHDWEGYTAQFLASDLADAFERLAGEKVQLRLALRLLQGMLRVMPKDDGRLYFDDDFDAMNFIENILKQTGQS